MQLSISLSLSLSVGSPSCSPGWGAVELQRALPLSPLGPPQAFRYHHIVILKSSRFAANQWNIPEPSGQSRVKAAS